MISHQRVWLSALAFSASVWLLLTVPGWLLAVWITSGKHFSIEAALHVGGFVAVFTTTIALYSIGLSLPMSYLAVWLRLRSFWPVALACVYLGLAAVVFWGFNGGHLLYAAVWAVLQGAVLFASAYVWWRVLTRQVTA